MSYKGKIKVYQQVEQFKPPAESYPECEKAFDVYCQMNGLASPSQRAASAQNPIYYHYLLDYVGYIDGDKKGEYIEHSRNTYLKASGRAFMAQMVANAIEKEMGCRALINFTKTEFISANVPFTTIASVRFTLEVFLPCEQNPIILKEGTGTAKRSGDANYSTTYIEKAETAARSRAIAAAGIGLDIAGGFSTIEDVMLSDAETEESPDSGARMAVQSMEAKIRACLNEENPNDALNKIAKEMKKEISTLSAGAKKHLSSVYQEVLAKANESSPQS